MARTINAARISVRFFDTFSLSSQRADYHVRPGQIRSR